MRKIILIAILGLLLGLIWISFSTPYVMSAQDTLRKEVDGIQISIRLNKTRFVHKEPIVLDLQITNVMRPGSGIAYDIYIPWVLSRPSTFYEVHAVDENGKDRIICGGMGKNFLEVLHLPTGHFCGYRLTCGSKGFGGRPDLQPGKYSLYAVFKNSYTKLPNSVFISIDTRHLTVKEREKMNEVISREMKRIERENKKLGQRSLWVGKVFSDSETIEIVQH